MSMRIHRISGWATVLLVPWLAFGLGCGSWEDQLNATDEPQVRDATEWPVYGGTDSLQFSPLAQINRDNVDDLQVAWTYRSGDVATQDDPTGPTSLKASPIR
jgi:quinoprotein glucose dehydrogenase